MKKGVTIMREKAAVQQEANSAVGLELADSSFQLTGSRVEDKGCH